MKNLCFRILFNFFFYNKCSDLSSFSVYHHFSKTVERYTGMSIEEEMHISETLTHNIFNIGTVAYLYAVIIFVDNQNGFFQIEISRHL